jgi:hypothetical protein
MADSTGQDLAIIGFQETTDDLNFLCLNNNPPLGSFSTREFEQYPVTSADSDTSLIYTAPMGRTYDTVFMSGVVLRLYPGGVFGGQLGIDDVIPHEGVNIPVSLNNEPSDVVSASATHVYFYDDGYENTEPLLEWDLDPKTPICTNENPQVMLESTDLDGDDVRFRVIAYDGHANEQDSGWTSYLTSGSSYMYTFNANETGSNLVLTMITEDDTNDSSGNTTETYYFSVNSGNNCHEVGTGNTVQGSSQPETGDEEALSEILDDVNDGLQSSVSDLPVLGQILASSNILFILYLLFVGGLIVTIFLNTGSVAISMIVTVVSVFVGTILGIIPALYVLILALIGFGIGMYIWASNSAGS